MFPVPFLEHFNGCLSCHKSLSPLKTHPDTKQTSPRCSAWGWAEKLSGAWRAGGTRMTAPDVTTVNSRLIFSAFAKTLPERTPSRSAGLPCLPPACYSHMVPGRSPWKKKRVSESPRMQLLLGRVEGERQEKMVLVKLCKVPLAAGLGCRGRKRTSTPCAGTLFKMQLNNRSFHHFMS